MSNLRGAVVGCGRMGAFTSELMLKWAPKCWHPLNHCEAIAATPNVELIAVCDIDASKVARAKVNFPNVRGFHHYEDLIRTVRPDVLGIATRTPDRPAIIHFAVSEGVRGLHIEKPLCNRFSELESITKIFNSAQLICTYGTLRRYIPIFSRARELVRSGRFGELQEIQVCFGSASLMWTHPHSFDLLSFFADDAVVSTVSACFKDNGVQRRGAFLDGDPIVQSVTVEFANGVTGLISQIGGNDVVLSCSNGAVIVESGGRRIRCRESLGGGDPYWENSTVDSYLDEAGGTRLAVERLVAGICDPSLDHVSTDKSAILTGHRALLASVQSYLEGGAAVCPKSLDPMLGISGRNRNSQSA